MQARAGSRKLQAGARTPLPGLSGDPVQQRSLPAPHAICPALPGLQWWPHLPFLAGGDPLGLARCAQCGPVSAGFPAARVGREGETVRAPSRVLSLPYGRWGASASQCAQNGLIQTSNSQEWWHWDSSLCGLPGWSLGLPPAWGPRAWPHLKLLFCLWAHAPLITHC